MPTIPCNNFAGSVVYQNIAFSLLPSPVPSLKRITNILKSFDSNQVVKVLSSTQSFLKKRSPVIPAFFKRESSSASYEDSF